MSTDTAQQPSKQPDPNANMGMEFSSESYLDMDLLRFLTCGSVDDGKSTLIGRLLYDSKSIFEDQLEAATQASLSRGDERMNLALLTDGLRAEREQGITIDVAYRYFATPKRKFIIADCPGHVQYTRNMVTGASTANLALILIDARHGVIEQTRRHAFICSLLRIPHLVVCVNKMDLVGWSKETYDKIRSDFESFASRFEITDITFIPMSALSGDNVVNRSENMPWYNGSSLLHHIENVHIAGDRDMIDPRFPVQWVVRPQSDEHHDYRGYGGQVASGVFQVGDEVMSLPSGMISRIRSIDIGGVGQPAAFPPQSVSIQLEDDIDISRGDMICRPNNQPKSGQDIDAMVVWMTDQPMVVGKKYQIRHTSNDARCIIKTLHYRMDIQTLHRDETAENLRLNEIGRISIRTTKPLFYDPYRQCRATGAFIIVDEATNNTVGAAMIIGPTT
jgi:bifunctional enzyme CysN/CysC